MADKKKKSFMNIIVKLSITVFYIFGGLLLAYSEAAAGDYYVSPTGTASWAQCVTPEITCSAVTGMNNAVAGDTVYFRGGTYHLTGDASNSTYTGTSTYQGRLQPANSGTSEASITFMAYPGEIPILDVDWYEAARLGRALGTNGRDYIIFDGFVIVGEGGQRPGGIVITGADSGEHSDYVIVRNCDISGGDLGPNLGDVYWGDNVEGVRIEGSTGTVIENCKLHDFVEHVSNGHNTSAIKMYYDFDTTIRNNNIYSNSCGIYVKRDNDRTRIENNYLYSNYIAEYVSGNDISSHGVTHLNNLYTDSSYEHVEITGEGTSVDMDGITFINNTFWGAAKGISIRGENNTLDAAIIFNNIFQGATTPIRTVYDFTHLKECDHNNLGSFSDIRLHVYGSASTTYYGLDAWKSSNALQGGSSPGTGSIAVDAMFVNQSGSMNQLADFTLSESSPCKGAGRNGVDMGADVSKVGIGYAGVGDALAPPHAPIDFMKETATF